MIATATINLTGISGRVYTFEIYPIDTTIKPVGAVYVFTSARPNANGGHIHNIVYIGQTGNLNERLSYHHKEGCIDRNGANRICIRVTPNESDRLRIEADLIAKYQPPCDG